MKVLSSLFQEWTVKQDSQDKFQCQILEQTNWATTEKQKSSPDENQYYSK